jgi:hypothetical protein
MGSLKKKERYIVEEQKGDSKNQSGGRFKRVGII